LCRLGGGAEYLANQLPGHTLGAGRCHRVDDLAFSSSAGDGRPFEEVLLDGPSVSGLRFVVLEPLGETVAVVEDLLM